MRNLLYSMVAAMLVFGGSALAQDVDVVIVEDSGYYAGLSAGYPGAALHFGIENVTTNLDARFNFGYTYAGTSGATIGADALYELDVDTDGAPVDVYVGGGVGANFAGTFYVRALGGGEFRLVDAGVPQIGVFAEVGPAFGFGTGGGFGLDGRLGVNYHF